MNETRVLVGDGIGREEAMALGWVGSGWRGRERKGHTAGACSESTRRDER